MGITGRLGSGKSSVSGFFAKKGFRVIDLDRIGHTLLRTSTIKKQLVSAFGARILKGDRVDRRRVAGVAFSSKRNLAKLNSILHPAIDSEASRRISGRNSIIEVPLPSKTALRFDCIIHVVCNQKTRIRRLLKRGLGIEDIKARMRFEEDPKKCHFRISNSGTIADTMKKLERAWAKIKKSA